ncbi:MAG: hypothetical protein WCQ77_15335, partial [Planctomycetota bacterium]
MEITGGTPLQSPTFNFPQDPSMTANNTDKKLEAATPTNKKSPKPAAEKKVSGKKAKKAEPISSKADLI